MIDQMSSWQDQQKAGLRRGLLCLSLTGEDVDILIREAAAVIHLADLVEIRLDSMRKPDIAPFVARYTTVPVLATNRPQWEGGHYNGSEEQRLLQLEAAMQAGAAYVDIELRTEAALRDTLLTKADTLGVWSLVSWHDFTGTPDNETLQGIVQAMQSSGARSGKIVTTAKKPADVVRLLALLNQATAAFFPLSAFAMGEVGSISRLATLYLGGHISYASVNESSSTAPGQLSLGRLHTLCELFEKTA